MEIWINFWNIFFWLMFFSFLFFSINFFQLLLFSEIIWGCLYIITLILGVYIDNCFLISLSFLLLALAGLEFSIGLLLLVFFKNINNTLFFTEDDKLLKTLFLKKLKLKNSFKNYW